ncbi:MAG TPA: CBS domain-containing protein [Nevskiaceae bacterium]|nr:CBS domain-containing protein [Nevskiaceae bacterium]
MATLDTLTAKDYMNTQMVTLAPDTDVMAAINIFVRRGIGSAPVVGENGKLLGMLSEKDCLKAALTASYEGVAAGPVKEFMSDKTVTVSPDTTVLEVASMFVDSNYKRYPVVKDGKLLGLISRANILRAINDHS